jgi:hypothetical protein
VAKVARLLGENRHRLNQHRGYSEEVISGINVGNPINFLHYSTRRFSWRAVHIFFNVEVLMYFAFVAVLLLHHIFRIDARYVNLFECIDCRMYIIPLTNVDKLSIFYKDVINLFLFNISYIFMEINVIYE